ncbi:hypothetical protein ElyMa_005195300 [Elysia marginata]|uniref:DUF7869 domain-containing protein n=1 Tax=Elysia marginata TaxID=1093978 RepID=A0AAV4JSY4_9GAST|nr:hypothetical protein ElyMa_005195300 [Elysia marginata]
MRGHHANRPHAMTDEERGLIISHIQSFRGRVSHYSRRKTRKVYLPEDINISKMHAMFVEKHPNVKCSYDTYRDTFNNKFNISFGYPRKDTCTTCDKLKVKLDSLNCKLNQTSLDSDTSIDLQRRKDRITATLELHQRKGEVFYERKKASRIEAQNNDDVEAVCFDFQKNLPLPNVTTQDVYFSRQLSFYSFNIHILSSDKVFFYCYDETVGKKGADDVSSMLNDFFTNHLPQTVRNLRLFCDSCAGQNKNWTVLRLMFYLVHTTKRFNTITMSFPVRGHSYMECDRDMANVNQAFPAELPKDWRNVLESTRAKPEPFNVINFPCEKFLKYSEFLQPHFLASCPFASRPIRELKICAGQPHLIQFRNSWNGPFTSAPVTKRNGRCCGARKGRQAAVARVAAPAYPKQAYPGPLPISHAKFKDLSKLKDFVSEDNKAFYDNLPHEGQTVNQVDSEPECITDSDSDSDSE